MNYLINKDTDKDKLYILLKAHESEEYLSFILMPNLLYEKLADLLIQEDVDYFWGLQYTEITEEEYLFFTKKLYYRWGKKVNIKNSNYTFWIVGSLPNQLIPYLREIK